MRILSDILKIFPAVNSSRGARKNRVSRGGGDQVLGSVIERVSCLDVRELARSNSGKLYLTSKWKERGSDERRS